MCSHCGVVYLRSEMWVDATGLLVCRDEGSGLDQVALARGIAEDSARLKRTVRKVDGYATDHTDDPPATGNPTPFDPSVRDI